MPGKETLYENFYTREAGSEKLRKTAQGRLTLLQRDGWHEIARKQVAPDCFQIHFEREGRQRRLPPLRRVPEPPPRRANRDRR
ncbi:MAG: hypothetical protein ACRDH6_04440 [Actinomycetota bacterium]